MNATRRAHRETAFAVAVIVLATVAAYSRSFSGALVFDDLSAVAGNPTIRHLWPLGPVLMPPAEGGDTVGGRPLLNLSLAINHAISGTQVWSYHLFNFAVHLGAALVLFGIVRRTLLSPRLRARFGAAAVPLAGAIATLWAVHPLQTESVVYIVQRAESLMALFYFLTLYGFIRGLESPKPVRWFLFSFLVCLGGMATKEVMVTAPVLILLYDRTFAAGGFREAWQQRKWQHLSLAATWILLGLLVISAGGNRGGTKGFGLGLAWWSFPLTQFQAVAHYLWLAFWPQPLVFEYERFWVTSVSQIFPDVLVVIPLGIAALVALWRWPAVGFLGVWFFGILAPSSLAPGASEMIAEHRMYLPLAAIVIALVLAGWRWLGARSLVAFGLIAFAAIITTVRRSEDYRTARVLWADTVAKRPLNGVAHGQLAAALVEEGQLDAAIAQYEEAIRLEQLSEAEGWRNLLAELQVNYGNALLAAGRIDDAVRAYARALTSDPTQKLAHFNLGSVLLEQGNLREARQHFVAALQLAPDYAPAHTNLGSLALREGNFDEALTHYAVVLHFEPDSAKAETNLGNAWLRAGRAAEAIVHLERAVQLQPDLAIAHDFLGEALLAVGRREESRRHYEEALRLDPTDADLRRRVERLTR